MTTPLGDKIRTLRKKKGYTLDRLAELAEFEQKLYLGAGEQRPAPAIGGQDCQDRRRAGVTTDYLITELVAVEDATDTAFFRKYRSMKPATKEKIRKMLDLMGDNK